MIPKHIDGAYQIPIKINSRNTKLEGKWPYFLQIIEDIRQNSTANLFYGVVTGSALIPKWALNRIMDPYSFMF